MLQTLALLSRSTDLQGSSPAEPEIWRRLAQAQAWADADRLYWVHDPRDGAVPTIGLLDPAYIARRARAMQIANGGPPMPGLPPGIDRYPFGHPDRSREQGTTQITIVDARGNIASYTSSVETIFGSRHLVAGMVMNNQLTDFALRPTRRAAAATGHRVGGMSSMNDGVPQRPTGAGFGSQRRNNRRCAAGITGLG